MTDIELTKACAEAMGIGLEWSHGKACCYEKDGDGEIIVDLYDPLHDDAQAMALVKKFHPILEPDPRGSDSWGATIIKWHAPTVTVRHAPDLNRAICECVAKLSGPPAER